MNLLQVNFRIVEIVNMIFGIRVFLQSKFSFFKIFFSSFYFTDCEEKGINSSRLVSCITTLLLFTKIRPQLMIKHAMTIQPYLTTKCNVSMKCNFKSDM